MFLSPAYAQGTNVASTLMGFAPIILMFVVFYFLLIRPQQKKARQHQELLNNLRRGDRVITTGGLIGTITKLISEKELQVEIAENVRVRILRPMITDVLAKTEPVMDNISSLASSSAIQNNSKENAEANVTPLRVITNEETKAENTLEGAAAPKKKTSSTAAKKITKSTITKPKK